MFKTLDDAWFWCLILTFDFDTWFWRFILMLNFDTRFWCFILMLDFDTCFWHLILTLWISITNERTNNANSRVASQLKTMGVYSQSKKWFSQPIGLIFSLISWNIVFCEYHFFGLTLHVFSYNSDLITNNLCLSSHLCLPCHLCLLNLQLQRFSP